MIKKVTRSPSLEYNIGVMTLKQTRRKTDMSPRHSAPLQKKTAGLIAGILLRSIPSLSCMILFLGSAYSAPVDEILAEVNGETITRYDYNLFIHRLVPSPDMHSVDEEMLGELIAQKMVIQEAKKKGFEADDAESDQFITDSLQKNALSIEDLEEKLAGWGVSLGEYKKWLKENVIILLKFVHKEIEPRVVITEGDMVNYYDTNVELFLEEPEKIRISCLFMPLSDTPSLSELTSLKIKSLKVYSAIKNGESPDKFADIYCAGSSPERDGILGEFRQGELLPALDRKISQMREGDISEPVWVKTGVYILKFNKRINAKYAPLKEVRDSIRIILFNEKREEIFRELLKSLWEKASVKIN